MLGLTIESKLQTFQTETSFVSKLANLASPFLMLHSPGTNDTQLLSSSIGEDCLYPPVVTTPDRSRQLLWQVLGLAGPECVDIQDQDTSVAPALRVADDLENSGIILLVIGSARVHHDPDDHR